MTAHATTATSARACAVWPGQKEDHAMTAATDTAPLISLETLEERRARIDAEDARLEPGYYAERFDGEERCLNENLASSVDAILDRVARRADGSLDLERLARLTVAAALQIDHHIGDHEANPWWERLA
jgi:hypothetical protein